MYLLSIMLHAYHAHFLQVLYYEATRDGAFIVAVEFQPPTGTTRARIAFENPVQRNQLPYKFG